MTLILIGEILSILYNAWTIVRLSIILLNESRMTTPFERSAVLKDFFTIEDCPKVD